jgi:uncharacterized protein YegL
MMASRPLHFFWVLDCSGSMAGGKIQSLNFAIRECLPAMQQEVQQNPECQMLVRVLTFSSGARWHVGQPTPVADFKWADVQAGGVTDMGRAMELLADALSMEAMGDRALPPVIVLLSDGGATDNFTGGLKRLMDQPWAKKAVRIAIGLGDDPDYDVLNRFIAHPEFTALRADKRPDTSEVHQVGIHRGHQERVRPRQPGGRDGPGDRRKRPDSHPTDARPVHRREPERRVVTVPDSRWGVVS